MSGSPEWMPGTCPEVLRLRASVLRELRQWFHDRGVTEVDTPALSRAATTDPQIASFSLRVGGRTMYLHTSPEFAMKRLLAAGSGDIYQICHVFRADESGPLHNPEFTMLEWYRVGLDMHAMMNDVESLVRTVCANRRAVPSFRRVPYRQLMLDTADVDPFTDPAEVLAAALESAQVEVPESVRSDRDALLDLLRITIAEPRQDPEQPVFVHDFPPSQAALARVRRGSPDVAERFELLVGGMELANGFRELTDPVEQQHRFRRELDRRAAAGHPLPPPDHRLIDALQAGVPECSGVALGLDRLLMYLAGSESIKEVLAFDITRA